VLPRICCAKQNPVPELVTLGWTARTGLDSFAARVTRFRAGKLDNCLASRIEKTYQRAYVCPGKGVIDETNQERSALAAVKKSHRKQNREKRPHTAGQRALPPLCDSAIRNHQSPDGQGISRSTNQNTETGIGTDGVRTHPLARLAPPISILECPTHTFIFAPNC
jgi:hypothetical protein